MGDNNEQEKNQPDTPHKVMRRLSKNRASFYKQCMQEMAGLDATAFLLAKNIKKLLLKLSKYVFQIYTILSSPAATLTVSSRPVFVTFIKVHGNNGLINGDAAWSTVTIF